MRASSSKFRRTFLPRQLQHLIASLSAVVMLLHTSVLLAQQPAPAKNRAAPAAKKTAPAQAKSTPAVNKPAPQAITPIESSLSSETERPFLTGDEWQDTLLRFEQWLQIQSLYDVEQVQQMRARFAERAQGTAAQDRAKFVQDVDAKLQILYGPGAADVQSYFAETLSVASPAYVKKRRQLLPDVVASTPDQLKDRLARFAVKHQSTVEAHQAFEQRRHLHIAAGEARAEARRVERPRPAAAQIASGGANSAPAKNNYVQARDYFPQNNSSISYSIIPAMPMMTSGGWAMFGGGVAITITRNR